MPIPSTISTICTCIALIDRAPFGNFCWCDHIFGRLGGRECGRNYRCRCRRACWRCRRCWRYHVRYWRRCGLIGPDIGSLRDKTANIGHSCAFVQGRSDCPCATMFRPAFAAPTTRSSATSATLCTAYFLMLYAIVAPWLSEVTNEIGCVVHHCTDYMSIHVDRIAALEKQHQYHLKGDRTDCRI